MNISVGILYSSQSFLKFVKAYDLKGSEFSKLFNNKFGVADPSLILKVALECNWVTMNIDNRLTVTQLGTEITTTTSPEEQLRVQISHLIDVYKPSWSALIHYGRAEAVKYFSPDVKQCFKEAGLLDQYDQNVINWWDRLANIARGKRNDENLEVGRTGERLSYEYEQSRTKSEPSWQSVESNFSGYDILSQLSIEDNTPLNIEVKTCNSTKDIYFYVTKHEWDIAETSNNYIFHIWVLNPKKQLYILSTEEMRYHIPLNKGNGTWESTKITFEREVLEKFHVDF